MLAIAILQATLPGELVIQAAIAIVAFSVVAGYWILFKIPVYNWKYVLIGVSLLSGSVALFALQNVYSPGYWAIHSLWHVAAAMGMHYIIMIKPKAYWFESAAARVGTKIPANIWIMA